jgi:hypothetical protein
VKERPVSPSTAQRVGGARVAAGGCQVSASHPPRTRDVVVVVEHDEAAEAEVPREAARLGRDALLEAPVAADDKRVRVDDGEAVTVELGAEVRLCDRHADRVGDALSERARRHLDRRVEDVLGVSRSHTVELPEALELRQREVIAGHVQHAVEKCTCVPVREHEPVTRGPAGGDV